jgi:protease PrsW
MTDDVNRGCDGNTGPGSVCQRPGRTPIPDGYDTLTSLGEPGTPEERPTPRLARWAWLVVLTVGLGLFEIVNHVLQTTHNPNLLPSLILLGAVAVPAAFVTFIYGLRLDYDVEAATLILVAFLGGIIGVVTAGLIEYQTLQRLGTLPAIAVALAEETTKLLVPLAILLFTRHRRLSDGLLIGVACGAGFAVMETMGYGAVLLVQSHQNLLAVNGLLLQRGLFSPATHMAWTGLIAAALWYAAREHWRSRAVAVLLSGYVAAVALHTAWDSAKSLPACIVIAGTSLGLLAFTTQRLSRPQSSNT